MQLILQSNIYLRKMTFNSKIDHLQYNFLVDSVYLLYEYKNQKL